MCPADISPVVKGQAKTPKAFPFAISADSRFLHYSARILTIGIAMGAFVLSFNALTDLAVAAGISPEFGWLWAASVDGFILIATVAAFVLQNKGKSRYYAWTILILFVLLSIFGNGWHAVLATDAAPSLPTAVAVLITAIPPITLFLSIHLLVLMVQPDQEQKKVIDRYRKRNERLRIIEEKEIERLEEAEVRKGIRDSHASKMITGAPMPLSTQTTVPIPPQISTAPPVLTGITPSSQEPVAQSALVGKNATETILNDVEMTEYLRELLELGKELPSGAAVARMMGKSERTGQNFIKKFKGEVGIL